MRYHFTVCLYVYLGGAPPRAGGGWGGVSLVRSEIC
jgi:hypothetical protein